MLLRLIEFSEPPLAPVEAYCFAQVLPYRIADGVEVLEHRPQIESVLAH